MLELQLPENIINKTLTIHGKRGQEWLKQLPNLLKKYQQLWDIKLVKIAAGLSYNLVIHVEDRLANKQLILKTAVPNPDFVKEIYALKYYAGNGCVQLINYDTVDCVILLEEATPGDTLADLSRNGTDPDAIIICSDIINCLHSKQFKPEHQTNTLADDYSEFARLKKTHSKSMLPIELEVITQAEQEYARLLKSTKKQVLLHADLHHYNILRAAREEWLAIDPKGILGDPAFEVVAFMRNPYPGILKIGETKKLMRDRLDLFADYLVFDKRRMWGWTFAHTVLAAAWLFEEQDANWSEWHFLAKILLELEPT